MASPPQGKQKLARVVTGLGATVAIATSLYLAWGQWRYLRERAAFDEALRSHEFAEAQRTFERLQQEWPNDRALPLLSARLAMGSGRRREAVRSLQAAETTLGSSPEVEFLQRSLGIRLGDLSSATAILNADGENASSPEWRELLESLVEGALLRLDSATLEKALRAWRQHFTSYRDQSIAAVWEARQALAENRKSDARCVLRSALESDAHFLESILLLAENLADEEPAEAQALLARLDSDQSADARLVRCRALVARASGELTKAADQLDGGLQQCPDDVGLLVLRGRVAIETQDLRLAEQVLRRAEEMAPLDPPLIRALADYYRLAGQRERSAEYETRWQTMLAKVKSSTRSSASIRSDNPQ
jgi:predicted Zn-dependent protease